LSRTSFFIFMILTAVIGGLLFWQWKAYSEKNDSLGRKQSESARQEITVESTANELKILQTISGLAEGKEYKVSVPEKVSSWKCLGEEGKPCKSNDRLPDTYLAEKGKIIFSYSIALSHNASSFLLNDWLVTLPNVTISSSKLEVVDYAKRGGSWVAGLPLKGNKQLDFIDYFVFEGESGSFSLYWQKKTLENVKNIPQISIFAESKDIEHVALSLPFAEFPYFSVVITDSYPEVQGEGIIVLKKYQQDALERIAFDLYFHTKFSKAKIEEQWMADVFSAYFTKQKSWEAKGEKILQELTYKLSEHELEEFMSSIIQEKGSLSAKKLDDRLSKQKGLKTRFFILNKEKAAPFIPLSFFDSRKVFMNGEERKGIEIYYQNEKRFYPFTDVLTGLGYEIKQITDEKSLILKKGNNNYRFYTDRKIFIYNEEEYGLLENPFHELNGKVYIEEKWLMALFKAKIEENEHQIRIYSS
jgi:hypothetical protein